MSIVIKYNPPSFACVYLSALHMSVRSLFAVGDFIPALNRMSVGLKTISHSFNLLHPLVNSIWDCESLCVCATKCLVPFCLSISCLTLSWIYHLGLLLFTHGMYTWSHFPFLILIIHHMWHFSPTSTKITPFICICSSSSTTHVAKSKGKPFIISWNNNISTCLRYD